MRYFSMFSGVGCFERAVELTYPNAECVGYCEIDPHASAVYNYHYPHHKNFGDATTIIPGDIPDFDILLAGFPCQAFSLAGKRMGFSETRGTLFFEILRVLKEKRPGFFLLENVDGLISHDDNETILTIHRELTGLGYTCQWTVVNSKEFGVPQSRNRIFFVGNLGDRSQPEILSVRPCSKGVTEKWDTAIVRCLTAGGHSGGHHSQMTLLNIRKNHDIKESDTSLTLDANYYKEVANQGRTFVKEPVVINCQPRTSKTGKGGTGTLSKQDGKAYALNTSGNSNQIIQLDQTKWNSQGVRIYDPNGLSVSLSAQGGGQGAKTGLYDMGNFRIRRLTPIECERLQFLPDNWTQYGDYNGVVKEISDTQRYKQTGNGATVSVIMALLRIFKFDKMINIS